MFGRIKVFIERLAKANEEAFGTGRLDCCKLNNRTRAWHSDTISQRSPVSYMDSGEKNA